MKRLLPLLLVVAISTALGCGPKRPFVVAPDHAARTVNAALNPSPLAGESVVLLPFEVASDVSVPEPVLAALADQHRRTLVGGRFVTRAYASLTEAEAAEPNRSFLMIRGTVQEYAPTVQERWGKAVRTSLALRMKYDVWNPADPNVTLTVRAKNADDLSFVDTETADGRPHDATTRRDLATLTEAAFLRFNQEMVGNQQIVRLARRGRSAP